MKKPLHRLIFLCLIVTTLFLLRCSLFNGIPPIQCPDANCEPENFALDSLNRKYKKGELVFSFPAGDEAIKDSSGVKMNNASYLKGVVSQAYASLNLNGIEEENDTIPHDSIDVIKCICDDNIFLIISETIIGSETNVAQASNSQESIGREGGLFSLNYIVEHDDEAIPRGIVDTTSTLSPENTQSNVISKNIVAILDSGIDFDLLASIDNGAGGIGIYDNSSINYSSCNILDDPHGYNFIGSGSPNNDIRDFNGHGSLVSLAYRSRLDSLGFLWDNQRMLTVRVLDECGNGTIFSTTCGLSYARKKGANVINCSWGIYFNDIQLERAVLQIPDSVAIICSAGNKEENLNLTDSIVHYPSGYGFDFTSATTDAVVSAWYANPDTNVYEVIALENDFLYNCNEPMFNFNAQRAEYSNKRNSAFAEAASNIQYLIPEYACGEQEINGTSFAAPSLSAGIVHIRTVSPTAPWICNPPCRQDVANRSMTISTPAYKCYTRLACY